MKSLVILLRCHFLNDEIIAQYLALRAACGDRYEVVFLYDRICQEPRPVEGGEVHAVDLDEIRKLGYRIWEGRGLWFHMDYPVLHYFRRHSWPQHFWVIEYDVRYEGSWGDFFAAFERNDSDVLSTYFRAYRDDPRWRWWSEHNLTVGRDRWSAIFGPVTRYFPGEI